MTTTTTGAIPLNDWAIVYLTQDPYVAPECLPTGLVGANPDGERVVLPQGTTEVTGRLVRAKDGILYELGEPQPAYREWLRTNRPNWDPDNPLAPPA